MQATRRHYTLDEYFALDDTSQIKLEYFGGTIFGMAGGSVRHNTIAANLYGLLWAAVKDGPCRVLGSDQRIRTADGLFTYPDLVVVCGEPELVPGRDDTITNPKLVVEVLSSSTREYDRTEKLATYQRTPSVMAVVLVEQERPDVVRILRTDAGWVEQRFASLDDIVRLDAIGAELPLRDAYARVFG